ncbi:unnamed protein product [Brachionus calyciflorus]|uniref:DOCKER domain-containing protein n=1 Tax=Brachionus calyciflorus TaxID=104777 RepID=A0A813QT95_9BILA|nr:unnamed protein product [Brachionus calyciflorus]
MYETQSLFDEYENNYKNFDDETKHNYEQLKYLIEYFNSNLSHEKLDVKSPSINSSNSLSNSSSNSSLDTTCLRNLLNNLNNLLDYYKNEKLNCKNLNFLQYLILKRFNYFNNNLFNLNKKLVLGSHNKDTIFDINTNYNNFDKLELNVLSEILNKNYIKLNICFNENLANNLGKYKFFENSDLNFRLGIFQFETKEKNYKIQKIKKTKRSLSAGAKIKNNKNFLVDINENSSSDETESEFSLNEKCLKSDFINPLINQNFILDLKPKTNKIILILYNLYSDYKIPVLTEYYKISDKLELKFLGSLNEVNKTEPRNSSMFRRIFKSKSKSRANSSQSKLQRASSNFDLNQPSNFLNVSLSLSNEFKNFLDPGNFIQIDKLNKWLSLWSPEIVDNNLKYNGFKTDYKSYINISMSLINCNLEINQRRSKFDQHQILKNKNLKQDENYYFLKLISVSFKTFISNIFKLKDLKLNDLIRIKLNENIKFKNLDLNLELYSFDRGKKESFLVESKNIQINWQTFYYNRENIVLNFKNLFNLKFKILTVHESNTDFVYQIDLVKFLNFNLNDQNELEFYNLIKNQGLVQLKFDLTLIEKYLEFFTILALNQKTNKKNLFRNKLLNRLFESFLVLIDSNKIDLNKLSIKVSHAKILQNWFMTNIKNLVELNQVKILQLLLKNFDFLIKLLVSLSNNFELKYNLNDLIIIKFFKYLNKDFILENLNMKFLDYLQELFNGIELGNMCIKLFGLNDSDNKEIKNRVIQLELFRQNFQFRETIFLLVLNDSVEFLKTVLNLKIKLSQSHLESLIGVSFKSILNSLIDNFKSQDLNQSIIDNFLVLIELINLIMSNNRFTLFNLLDQNLLNLFDVIECYFKFNQSILSSQTRLCLEIDLILFKFFKYIQKFLLRYLINKSNLDLEIVLFKSYYSMLFSYLKDKNFNFYPFFYKVKILDSAYLFWKCLNIRLKNSEDLSEFLIQKILECFFNNFYVKSIRLKIDVDELEFNSFGPILSLNLIQNFYESLLKFLNQINMVQKETIFFYLIEIIVKNEKNKKINPYEHIEFSPISEVYQLKSQARIILDMSLKTIIPDIWNLINLALDYHFLKDVYEIDSSVSSIESFLLIYSLLKQVESTQDSESKRKIKLYLLDDLYYMNKIEKNHLLMSFIRKEQADLLQWENESNLKEILYLKSLKKFAINSLQDKFLVQESSYLSEYYKSFKNSDKEGFIKSIQFEICKQLSGYYEKLDESYPKIARILNAESKFTQLISKNGENLNLESSKNHGHLYFRVGLFGKSLKFESIQNKYYIYKHKSYEMLSNIQNLIRNRLTYSKWCENENESLVTVNNTFLLLHNHEPDNLVKESIDKCFIQVCAVNKLEKIKFFDLIEENFLDQETENFNYLKNESLNDNLYYFDRPFYSKNLESCSIIEDYEDFERVKENESVENLWIERSVLILDNSKYENISQFEEIKSIVKINLNPIRNAITDINEKTKELKNFVVQFTANNSQNSDLNLIHSLQPLTMRLLGCLDARVNGGLIKYVKELLNESVYSNKKYSNNRKKLFSQLYSSIKSQLSVLESGLSIHDRILTNIEDSLMDSPSENLTEHIKHMNELNKHLIECLRIVHNELDDRWSKFC